MCVCELKHHTIACMVRGVSRLNPRPLLGKIRSGMHASSLKCYLSRSGARLQMDWACLVRPGLRSAVTGSALDERQRRKGLRCHATDFYLHETLATEAQVDLVSVDGTQGEAAGRSLK